MVRTVSDQNDPNIGTNQYCRLAAKNVAKRSTKLQLLQKSGPPAKVGQATETICSDFLDYLRGECHLSANTVAAYGRDLQRFVGWLI